MSLDWQIYCELVRRSPDPVWGMFPHPPVGTIAQRLGIARNTVWRRLKEWERDGFLRGFEVIPNPALLGVGLRSYFVTIPEPSAKQHFVEQLELIDGVFIVTIDLGTNAVLITVADLPSSQARRERLLRGISGVASVSRGTPVWLPTSARTLSIEEWRFISVLRANPTWSLERLAKALGISTKTASRRYDSLTQDRAILSFVVENFAKFPGVVGGVTILLAPGVDSRSVAQEVQRLVPDALEIPSVARAPGAPSSKLSFVRLIRSASEAEAIAGLGIPGFEHVSTFFPGVVKAYRRWFDERIAEVLARKWA
ncbi:MAG: Lrp/AsnC family transcriptional regulator [Thermoplasmata archaeon]|nr:Lrp/AsnC family transcriptional regulator [Thermoplasmata archaeon]